MSIRFDRKRRQVLRFKRSDYDRTGMCGDDVRLMTAGAGVGRERPPQAPTENPEALQVVGRSRHYDFARHSRCGVPFSYPSEEKLAISSDCPQGVLR